WSRGEDDRIEGLYTSPVVPDAAAHTARVVADLARRYDLDGIHLDYARYPNQQFDYSRFAIAEFRASMQPRLAPAVRRALAEAEQAGFFSCSPPLPLALALT